MTSYLRQLLAGFPQRCIRKGVEEELKRTTPPNSELLKLADRFPAPQGWYDEEVGE